MRCVLPARINLAHDVSSSSSLLVADLVHPKNTCILHGVGPSPPVCELCRWRLRSPRWSSTPALCRTSARSPGALPPRAAQPLACMWLPWGMSPASQCDSPQARLPGAACLHDAVMWCMHSLVLARHTIQGIEAGAAGAAALLHGSVSDVWALAWLGARTRQGPRRAHQGADSASAL